MKTYKGMELFEAVMNYKLKGGTKLKCIHYPIYGQGVEVDGSKQILIWSDTKEPVNYAHFNDSPFEFQIIEEESTNIEELKKEMSKLQSEIDLLSNEIGSYHNKIHSMRDRNNYMKEQLKDLRKAINYLLEKESDK